MALKNRQILRELDHMEQYGDAISGALERKDIGSAKISLNLLRGLIGGAKEHYERVPRKSDGR